MNYKLVFYLLCNFLVSLTSYGQLPNTRLFGEISISKSYAYFGSGTNLSVDNNDIAFLNATDYKIKSGNSVDWQRQPDMSFIENFGRNFHVKLGVQRALNQRFSLSTAFEIGSRSFVIYKDDGIHIFRNYRNYALPILGNYSWQLNEKHYITGSTGLSLNLPASVTQGDFFYKTNAFNPVYILAVLGIEWEKRFKNGSGIAANIGYNLGFYNMIDDKLLYDINYKSTNKYGRGESKVYSNGTHINAGLRFYYRTNRSSKKNNKFKIKEPLKIDFSKRLIEKPKVITVDTNIITVCFWDDQRIDGDSISIEYKDTLIVENISLIKTKKCVELKIEKSQPNYLIVHALNEGRVKPNTIKVTIRSAKGETIIDIRADLIKSGAVNLQIE